MLTLVYLTKYAAHCYGPMSSVCVSPPLPWDGHVHMHLACHLEIRHRGSAAQATCIARCSSAWSQPFLALIGNTLHTCGRFSQVFPQDRCNYAQFVEPVALKCPDASNTTGRKLSMLLQRLPLRQSPR